MKVILLVSSFNLGILAPDVPYCPYTFFFALFVETSAERELRHSIGMELLKEPNVPVESLKDKVRKPIRSFVIYRWLQQLLKLPLDHPLFPLYSQVGHN
jgi:hypothetical protein